jgi:3-oxoacyl-[acyl-carrier-protein] synthase-3
MHMSGGEVFKFATRVVHDSIREASERAGVALDDIKLVIPHQANQRILMSAARKLKMDIDRFMSNVDKYGNTSAASIPIALCEAIEDGRINQDDHIVMVGFGGGLSWASMVVQWGVPEPGEQQGTRINRQRRRFLYFWARWRSRWNRWKRNISQMVERIRPDRGRIFRLKRRVDEEDELDD